MDHDAFLTYVSDVLYGLSGVEAVALGGSRGRGTHRADSDWDLGIYYRGHFNPQALRDQGWPGEVSEIGGWSTGIFNGGARLVIEERYVDMHYRDLETIDHEIAESRQGRFCIESVGFHLAGIPSYIVLAELAINRVLRGQLPKPDYPAALRDRAPGVWWGRADRTFAYASANYAARGQFMQCIGLVAQAVSQAAHALLAARGQWVTNEKTLLAQAGLCEVGGIVAAGEPDPKVLDQVVSQSRAVCAKALLKARSSSLARSRNPGEPCRS